MRQVKSLLRLSLAPTSLSRALCYRASSPEAAAGLQPESTRVRESCRERGDVAAEKLHRGVGEASCPAATRRPHRTHRALPEDIPACTVDPCREPLIEFQSTLCA